MIDKSDAQARQWAMFCHLAALAGFIGIPFGHILGPLIIWLIKKDEFPYVNQQGKESLNFQISMTIYGIIAAILIIVLVGIVLLPILLVVDVVLIILAAIKANNGEDFKYPFCIRFIS